MPHVSILFWHVHHSLMDHKHGFEIHFFGAEARHQVGYPPLFENSQLNLDWCGPPFFLTWRPETFNNTDLHRLSDLTLQLPLRSSDERVVNPSETLRFSGSSTSSILSFFQQTDQLPVAVCVPHVATVKFSPPNQFYPRKMHSTSNQRFLTAALNVFILRIWVRFSVLFFNV